MQGVVLGEDHLEACLIPEEGLEGAQRVAYLAAGVVGHALVLEEV